jgi:CRISPR-associated protein Csx17
MTDSRPNDTPSNDENNAGSIDDSRLDQLRQTRRLTSRERLEMLDRPNRDPARLHGIARERPASHRDVPSVQGWSVQPLGGCGPKPLADYLKALGVLKILSEQVEVDTAADGASSPTRMRGWWEDERFVLWSPLDREGIEDFLLHQYRPTPILAPWNGGSGFFEGAAYRTAIQALEAIENASADRLRPYVAAISAARKEIRRSGLTSGPSGDEKEELLQRARSSFPDPALDWLDAAIVLSADGPKYPPLLGTGGNDGRLEFTNNFMQRLVDVIDPATGEPTDVAAPLLREALFGDPVPGLGKDAIGQFSPGVAGGPNTTSGFSGDARVNPWDFVLMLEGAVLFAARIARRLESDTLGHLAFPFTVRAVGAGTGAANTGDEGNARAETWVPIWHRPASLLEVGGLLGEGRVSVGRQTAGDGLDFVRAVSKLGAERGIRSFERYGFLMRSGRSYFATPLGRIQVRRYPSADLIDELDREQWLGRFRRWARSDDRPARVKSLVRRLDEALFQFAEGRPAPTPHAQSVLVVLSEVQDYLATSPAARERLRPVPYLASEWFEEADDGSAEFRLAAAFAGIRARRTNKSGFDEFLLPLIGNLWPVQRFRARGQLVHRWDEGGVNRAVWGPGSIDANLAAVLARRLLDRRSESIPDLPLDSSRGVRLPVLSQWVSGDLDDRRVARLTKALAVVDLPHPERADAGEGSPTPAALAVLKPLFTPARQLRRRGFLDHEEPLSDPSRVARLLSAHRLDEAIELGTRLLRVRGINPPATTLSTHAVDGPRLLSALLVPLTDGALAELLDPLSGYAEPSDSTPADSPQTMETDR